MMLSPYYAVTGRRIATRDTVTGTIPKLDIPEGYRRGTTEQHITDTPSLEGLLEDGLLARRRLS
jgi:hypothetical protein